jgi:hypothetical protein
MSRYTARLAYLLVGLVVISHLGANVVENFFYCRYYEYDVFEVRAPQSKYPYPTDNNYCFSNWLYL